MSTKGAPWVAANGNGFSTKWNMQAPWWGSLHFKPPQQTHLLPSKSPLQSVEEAGAPRAELFPPASLQLTPSGPSFSPLAVKNELRCGYPRCKSRWNGCCLPSPKVHELRDSGCNYTPANTTGNAFCACMQSFSKCRKPALNQESSRCCYISHKVPVPETVLEENSFV